jgi:nitrogen fixation-related uncharacterized protein
MLKNKKILVSLVVVCIAAAIGLAIFLQSADKDQAVAEGQDILVTIKADSFDDLYGYQFRLYYDPDELEFTNSLKSNLTDIYSIFSKPMDGYELVGATMVGPREGISATNKVVCEMRFTAKKDGTTSGLNLSLSAVNVVKSDLEYLTDVEGWHYELSAIEAK